MKLSQPLRLLLLFVFVCAGTQLFAQKVNGVLPDKSAKAGTWTEWQSVKDSSGTEIAQYRIRMAGSKKFVGETRECHFEVEVVNKTSHTLTVDLDYSFTQTIAGNTKSDSKHLDGIITKKGKSWTFEMLLFNDATGNDKTGACFGCDLSYTLTFGVSKY